MAFGLEKQEIESKVLEELRKHRGGLKRFDDYQIEAIADAVASVILENNTKIQYTLGEAGIDFK